MNVSEVVKSIVERIAAENAAASRSNEVLHCPTEARLLAYCENHLSAHENEEMYQHLASCNRCIEFLAMFLQLSEVADNEAEAQARWQLEAADPELRNLTDMVLALLDQDEINFGNSSA